MRQTTSDSIRENSDGRAGYTHARTHVRTHACEHVCTHACACTCTGMYARAHALTHARTHAQGRVLLLICSGAAHTHTCVHMHTRAHMHKRKSACTCARTHKYIRECIKNARTYCGVHTHRAMRSDQRKCPSQRCHMLGPQLPVYCLFCPHNVRAWRVRAWRVWAWWVWAWQVAL